MCNLYTEKENLIVFYKISYNSNLIYTETQTKTARFIASTYIEILSKYMPHPSTRLYKYWIPLLPALLLNFTITWLISLTDSDSCEPILWNCTARTTLIDPCSCYRYYECRGHGNGIVERTCPSGTAYDHETKTCPNRASVVPSQCLPSRPWERCNLNGIQVLHARFFLF